MAESEMYAVNGDLSIPKPEGVSEVYIVNGDTSVACPKGVSPVYAVNGDTSIPRPSGVSPIYVGNIESEVERPVGVSVVKIGNFSVTPPEPPAPDVWLRLSISGGSVYDTSAYIQQIGKIYLSDSPEGYNMTDLTSYGVTRERYPLSYKAPKGSSYTETDQSVSEINAIMGGTAVNTSSFVFSTVVKLPKGKKPLMVKFTYAFRQHNNATVRFSVTKGTVENGSFVSEGSLGSDSVKPSSTTSLTTKYFALTWPS